jgi:hypothetical protein
MVEGVTLSLVSHRRRLADRGEMVSQLCRMAAIEKSFDETESYH